MDLIWSGCICMILNEYVQPSSLVAASCSAFIPYAFYCSIRAPFVEGQHALLFWSRVHVLTEKRTSSSDGALCMLASAHFFIVVGLVTMHPCSIVCQMDAETCVYTRAPLNIKHGEQVSLYMHHCKHKLPKSALHASILTAPQGSY